MKLEPGKFCPLIKKDCIGIQCSWFTQIRGTNPNTGQDIDEWGCAVTWMPILQIENSQQSRQAGAAVESLRNELVKVSHENKQLYSHYMEQQKINPQGSHTNKNNILNYGD